VNLCRSCGEDFAGLSAFDRHRVGTHAYRWSPDRQDGRRCLVGDELLVPGMERDPRGRWRVALPESERSRLQGLGAQGSPQDALAAGQTTGDQAQTDLSAAALARLRPRPHPSVGATTSLKSDDESERQSDGT
jgi:hypothetical protein